MRMNPPRVGEILVGAFSVLLFLCLFLPWYRTSDPADVGCAPQATDCPGETATAFQAFAVLDIVLVLVAAAGVALLVLETTQRTPAIPVAWSAVLVPLAVAAVGLVLWRTLDPPAGPRDEPVFALLGLAACFGLAIAATVSMRSESYGWRADAGAAGTGSGQGGPEPLPVPSVASDGPAERAR